MKMQVLNKGGILVTDSREVATQVGKLHTHVLRDIKGYKAILDQNPNLDSAQFFIEDTYTNENNQTYPCYLLTRKGCDMVANKMTGTKGVLFTAEYVTRFEEMEKNIQKQLSPMDQLKLQLKVLEEQDKKIEVIDNKVNNLESNMPLFNIECKELQALVKSIGTKALGGYKSQAYNDNSLRGKVYADIQRELKRQFAVNRYEAIKRSQLEVAKSIVEGYKLPLVLENQINLLNNQIAM
jgi:Rha family phage regulatory protein